MMLTRTAGIALALALGAPLIAFTAGGAAPRTPAAASAPARPPPARRS